MEYEPHTRASKMWGGNLLFWMPSFLTEIISTPIKKKKPSHVLQRWAKWLQGGGGDMGVDKDKIKTPAPKQPLTRLTGPLSCEGSDISSFNNFGCTFIETSVPLF